MVRAGMAVVNIIISSHQAQHSGRPPPLLSSDLLSGGRKESEAAASFPVVLTVKYRP